MLSQHAEPLYAIGLFEDGFRTAALIPEGTSQGPDGARPRASGGRKRKIGRRLAESSTLTSPARRRHEDSHIDQLTPRELEILGLIAEGKSNSAIAESVMITKRAVERHVNSIFLKLDLRESVDVSRRVKAVLLYLGG